MNNVAVLGLGAMGSRMAINLSNAGHRVTVWNRTTEHAVALANSHDVTVSATPCSAADGADVVVSMVSDDDAAYRVWLDPDDGALSSLGTTATAIESSTLSSAGIATLGEAFAVAGRTFVEAPVVGSRPQAEAGGLFYLLGGDAPSIAAVQPIIDVNAGASKHVGPTGSATVMKLVINGLFASQVALLAEAVAVLERSTVDVPDAIELLSGLPITAPGLARILGLIGTRTYTPNFPVHLVTKDLRYLTAFARNVDAPTAVIDQAHRVFTDAANGPSRDLDISGVAAHLGLT